MRPTRHQLEQELGDLWPMHDALEVEVVRLRTAIEELETELARLQGLWVAAGNHMYTSEDYGNFYWTKQGERHDEQVDTEVQEADTEEEGDGPRC